MYKYINWIIFAFVVVQMALSAKHNEVCWMIAWGVMTLVILMVLRWKRACIVRQGIFK